MADYSIKTDEQLVLLCRKDDADAWMELYGRYTAVSRVISRKFSSNGETDDLVQEGLIGFLSAVHSYKEDKGASFKTYAWTCIRNRIANAVKGKGNGNMDCQSFEILGNVPDKALSPEERMKSKNATDRIFAAVNNKLSEKERAVFRLYLEGKTYDEIGDILSMSRKSVDGSLQRARKKLKSELDAQ